MNEAIVAVIIASYLFFFMGMFVVINFNFKLKEIIYKLERTNKKLEEVDDSMREIKYRK